MDLHAMATRARAAVRAGLLASTLATAGCIPGDDAGDESAAGSSASDGSGDGVSSADDDSGGPGQDDVPSSGYCAGVVEWSDEARAFELEVVDRVNQERSQGAACGGQPFAATGPLAMEGRLRCAARVHSLDMSVRGFFDHVNPDGEDPFARMERAGYQFSAAGENIAAGQPTPQEVVDGWMQSPGHCMNIMGPDFTQIGVGYVSAPQAQFPHYWTQVFGTPL